MHSGVEEQRAVAESASATTALKPGVPKPGPAPVQALAAPRTRAAGLLLLALAAYVSRSLHSGLTTARRLIVDFEAAHGELQIENGYWSHADAPAQAARIFCDQIDAAAGWLYPFGVLVWLPVILLAFAGSVLAVRSTRSRIPAVVLTILAIAAIVVIAAAFGSVYGDVIAILE